MRCDPRSANVQLLTVTLKHFHQGGVAQWFVAPGSFAADKKNKSIVGASWSLLHNIGAESLKGIRIVQIHEAFDPRFRAHTFGMIVGATNNDAPTPILNVFQPQVQDFSRSQSAMEHEQKDRFVPERVERVE